MLTPRSSWAGWGTIFPSILTALYFAGANLNAADQSHNTPLHLAALENQVQTLNELVKYGAKLDMANLWQQRTPLGLAVAVRRMARAFANTRGVRLVLFGLTLLRQANNIEAADALRAAGANKEYITKLPGACVTAPASLSQVPPCTTLARCGDDTSNFELGATDWGCYQNNHFMQEQPIVEPQPPGPPEPGEQLNVIQGTCVS